MSLLQRFLIFLLGAMAAWSVDQDLWLGFVLATVLGFWLIFDTHGLDDFREKPPTYRTKTGRVLTDEDIQALADEAERGYDLDQIEERGIHRGRRN